LYPLQITEDQEVRKSGFVADRAESNDEGLNDVKGDANESASASPIDDESKEEEGYEMLGHLSKSLPSISLKDWPQDSDNEASEPHAILNATTLHVAAADAKQGRLTPTICLPASPEKQATVLEPAASKKKPTAESISQKRRACQLKRSRLRRRRRKSWHRLRRASFHPRGLRRRPQSVRPLRWRGRFPFCLSVLVSLLLSW
jgi:hypothetical protein